MWKTNQKNVKGRRSIKMIKDIFSRAEKEKMKEEAEYKKFHDSGLSVMNTIYMLDPPVALGDRVCPDDVKILIASNTGEKTFLTYADGGTCLNAFCHATACYELKNGFSATPDVLMELSRGADASLAFFMIFFDALMYFGYSDMLDKDAADEEIQKATDKLKNHWHTFEIRTVADITDFFTACIMSPAYLYLASHAIQARLVNRTSNDENPYYTDCMPDYLKYTIEGPTPDLRKRYGGNPDAPIENEFTDKDKNSSVDEEVEIEDNLTDKIIKKESEDD